MSLADKLENLTTYYKENRNTFNDNFRLKMHRTLSWLKKANEEENLDFKFIALWIAFNAAYADELVKKKLNVRYFINLLLAFVNWILNIYFMELFGMNFQVQ